MRDEGRKVLLFVYRFERLTQKKMFLLRLDWVRMGSVFHFLEREVGGAHFAIAFMRVIILAGLALTASRANSSPWSIIVSRYWSRAISLQTCWSFEGSRSPASRTTSAAAWVWARARSLMAWALRK